MTTLLPPNDERLLARLNQHPQLRARIERLVDLVEDAGDDLRKADEAERRVIEEVRRLGQEVLEDWADGQVTKRADELDQTPGVWRDGNKTLLAQHLRRHRSHRAAVPGGDAAAASLCAECAGGAPQLLAAVAAGADRPGGGSAVRASG